MYAISSLVSSPLLRLLGTFRRIAVVPIVVSSPIFFQIREGHLMDTISDGVSNLSSKVTGLSPSSFFPWLRLVLPKSSSHHGQLSVSSTADFIPVIYSSSFCSSRCRAICRLQAVPCRQPQAPPIIHFSASLSPLTIPSPLVRPRMPIMDPSQRKLSFPSSSPVKSGEPRDFWVSIGP